MRLQYDIPQNDKLVVVRFLFLLLAYLQRENDNAYSSLIECHTQ